MNERESKPFVTPGNHTVVLRTYLTGKESAALKAIMYSEDADQRERRRIRQGRPR